MQLAVNDFIKIFDAWAEAMLNNKEKLIKLDTIVGDGDLGLSMTDGFNAMQRFAHDTDITDLGLFFYNAGKTMNMMASSSLGTLISAGFMEAGKAFKGKETMAGMEIGKLLQTFEDGVVNRGKAKVGEKTFLDGFDPAVKVMLSVASEEDVPQALKEASIAAHAGSASTVGMLACWGRASRRGEDSRQVLDPGSVVASILISAMSNCLND